jgi:hypothetical protein
MARRPQEQELSQEDFEAAFGRSNSSELWENGHLETKPQSNGALLYKLIFGNMKLPKLKKPQMLRRKNNKKSEPPQQEKPDWIATGSLSSRSSLPAIPEYEEEISCGHF